MTCAKSYSRLTTCYLIGLLAACFLITLGTTTNSEKLDVQVYYEALCPDSKRFVRYQLYDGMKDNAWLAFTELEFVPFGKASFYNNTQTNEIEIYCQHGNDECELNAWHACIVEHHPIADQLELIHCMLGSDENIIDECGKNLKLNVTAVKDCKRTRTTVDILRKYGDMTDAIQLTFVPSVAFDKRFDPFAQQSIFNNFAGAFCKEYKKKYNRTITNCD